MPSKSTHEAAAGNTSCWMCATTERRKFQLAFFFGTALEKSVIVSSTDFWKSSSSMHTVLVQASIWKKHFIINLLLHYFQCFSLIEITCPSLHTPLNGTKSSEDVTVDGVVTFSCNRGYTLSGTSSLQCEPTGSWNGTAPHCSGEVLKEVLQKQIAMSPRKYNTSTHCGDETFYWKTSINSI